MSNPFFDHPVLNSPYDYPARHWELDATGQPTQQIIENRRRAEFITPIPKPKKRKKPSAQQEFIFDEGKGLSSKDQQYDPTSIINEIRQYVDQWRAWPNPSDWQVTPETARLLQHWRHHRYSGPEDKRVYDGAYLGHEPDCNICSRGLWGVNGSVWHNAHSYLHCW